MYWLRDHGRGKPVNASPRERELARFRPVTELALPSRATNALLRNGVRSVGQLIARSKEDLMTEIMGLGEGMLKVIEASLALENLSLAPTDKPSVAFAQVPPRRARSRSKTDRHVTNHKAWIGPRDDNP